jgi:acetyltransferase-like isoleucine patch superfamily enzyme
MKPAALWRRTPLAGFANSAVFATRGVRLHPGVRVYGNARALSIGPGSKIGAGCVFNLGAAGRIGLGRKVWTYRDAEFHTDTRIDIGAGVSFQRAVLVNGSVSIGRGCIFAPGVFLSSGKHIYDLKPAWPIRAQEAFYASAPADPDVMAYVLDRPVRIDEDCWLGAHVVVAPGVRIGRGAVVGANSVVTRDVEPYAIVGGAPARPIRRRLEWRPPLVIDATAPEARPYLYSGFDVEEENGRVAARVAGGASVALAADAGAVFEAAFVAEADGVLQVGGTAQPFRQGEQTLRWTDCAPSPSFDGTVILTLDFAFRQPGAGARLLRCGFAE